jgi:hypothetical protein
MIIPFYFNILLRFLIYRFIYSIYTKQVNSYLLISDYYYYVGDNSSYDNSKENKEDNYNSDESDNSDTTMTQDKYDSTIGAISNRNRDLVQKLLYNNIQGILDKGLPVDELDKAGLEKLKKTFPHAFESGVSETEALEELLEYIEDELKYSGNYTPSQHNSNSGANRSVDENINEDNSEENLNASESSTEAESSTPEAEDDLDHDDWNIYDAD